MLTHLVTLSLLIHAFGANVMAATEIQWWHSMAGDNAEWVMDLAKRFNESQKDVKVTPIYKGKYDESMTAAIAAYRSGNAPHILQVYEVGTATMIHSKGAIKPVGEVMSDAGLSFNPKDFVPAVSSYYTASNGQMLSFPFNSSTTIFFYNQETFRKAGLDPTKPPKTWPEVAIAVEKLKASGSECPLTTAWQGWTQLESFSAWHGVDFATQNNGFDGLGARLQFNSPLHVRHIGQLAEWAKKKWFVYKGRGNAADASFISGECAILIGSSATYANTKANAKFAFGLSSLPYYPDVKDAPQNTIIGGASLWVMSGKKPEEYRAIARFFDFLSKPVLQSESHKRTGYLPITTAAFALTEKSGFYRQFPGSDVAVNQMLRNKNPKKNPTKNQKMIGLRLGNMVQIRSIVDEELEQVWAGKKSAQEALDGAVQRGNEALTRFESTQK